MPKQGKQRRRELMGKLLNDKEIDQDKRDLNFEKGDMFAMFLAISCYLIPAFIAIVALFFLFIWSFLLR